LPHHTIYLPSLPIFFFLLLRPPPTSTLFPYTTLFRSALVAQLGRRRDPRRVPSLEGEQAQPRPGPLRAGPLLRAAGRAPGLLHLDRKSTRLNSSHVAISYAVFCLKKNRRMADGDSL